MERETKLKRWISDTQVLLDLLLSLPFLTFSTDFKDDLRAEQEFKCAVCGIIPRKLEIHHIVPRKFEGSDNPENAVGLCPNCHDVWDSLFDEGIFYPGIKAAETKSEQWKSQIAREKVIYRFRKK